VFDGLTRSGYGGCPSPPAEWLRRTFEHQLDPQIDVLHHLLHGDLLRFVRPGHSPMARTAAAAALRQAGSWRLTGATPFASGQCCGHITGETLHSSERLDMLLGGPGSHHPGRATSGSGALQRAAGPDRTEARVPRGAGLSWLVGPARRLVHVQLLGQRVQLRRPIAMRGQSYAPRSGELAGGVGIRSGGAISALPPTPWPLGPASASRAPGPRI
jgi:hypothetical protein